MAEAIDALTARRSRCLRCASVTLVFRQCLEKSDQNDRWASVAKRQASRSGVESYLMRHINYSEDRVLSCAARIHSTALRRNHQALYGRNPEAHREFRSKPSG
jgi:hypothetical protein